MEGTLLTIVSFILVLGVLVFFHELGHYWVARRNGIVVEEFGFGYPPRVLKLFTYGGTVFTLNLLPFGGFARMKGEDAGDMSPGSFNGASKSARAATLIAGPAMNMFLAILLFALSYLAGFPAMAGYPQLTAVAPDSAAAQLDLQPGDILLAWNGAPVQVSAQPGDHITMARPGTADETNGVLQVSRGGRMVEVADVDGATLAAILAARQFMPVLMTQISGVAEGSPAAAAGLRAGDLVLAVDGATITLDQPLNEVIRAHLGEQITLTVWRDGGWQEIPVTPRLNPPPGQGAMGVQIGGVTQMANMGVLPAIWEGILNTFQYAFLVLQLPFLLLLGQLSPAEAQISGPVGIAQMVGGAVSATISTGFWFPILRLSAVLSAALAVTNLLPLPALDGGRLLFIAVEAIRGRRVNPEREGLVHMVGFALLLGLMLIITVRDLTSAPQTIDWARLMGQ